MIFSRHTTKDSFRADSGKQSLIRSPLWQVRQDHQIPLCSDVLVIHRAEKISGIFIRQTDKILWWAGCGPWRKSQVSNFSLNQESVHLLHFRLWNPCVNSVAHSFYFNTHLKNVQTILSSQATGWLCLSVGDSGFYRTIDTSAILWSCWHGWK